MIGDFRPELLDYLEFLKDEAELYEFTTCERTNGTRYGTAGQCRKGTEVEPTEKETASKGGGGGSSTREVAREYINRYAQAEPQQTADIVALGKRHGLEPEGLAFRLKSEESLARKIDAEKANYGGDARKAAADMSDINRYTLRAPAGNYGPAVKAAIKDLESQGYKLRVKNYWGPGQPYRGINVAMTAPDGRKVELQFHTAGSLRVKERIHKDYEEFRTLDKSSDNPRRRRLWNRMSGLSSRIPMPKGAEDLGGESARKQLKYEDI